VELRSGSPAEQLSEAATKKHASLVVVSSLGQVAASRFFVGSVAERTAEMSPVATLVVRREEPLLAWAQGERALKILVCYDFSATSDAALEWVKSLHLIEACDIIVGHVNWPPGEIIRLGLPGPVSLLENPPEAERVVQRDLKERVSAVLGQNSASLRIIPNWGRVDAQLIKLAHDEKVDLIVVGTHQRHGMERLLGSVSRAVLRHSGRNIAIIPLPKRLDANATRISELKRILVATDFSEPGNRAISYACATGHRGATVKIIHVLASHQGRASMFTENQSDHPAEENAGELIPKLAALIPLEAAQRGIQTELEIIKGANPAKLSSRKEKGLELI
jgi:nucleotide-binding universal stress UspA family protein